MESGEGLGHIFCRYALLSAYFHNEWVCDRDLNGLASSCTSTCGNVNVSVYQYGCCSAAAIYFGVNLTCIIKQCR